MNAPTADIALVWFRRDLRLADHPALHAALSRHAQVLPVYIHAPDEEAAWAPGGASRWWLHHSLKALGADLSKLGATLVLRHGDSLGELRALAAATGARTVYMTRRYAPAEAARDARVAAALKDEGIHCKRYGGHLLFEPEAITTKTGGWFKVFTPFWNNAGARLRQELHTGRAPLPPPQRIPAPAQTPPSLPLDSLGLLPRIAWDGGLAASWTPGEAGAQALFDGFCASAVDDYRQQRDYPAAPGTSRLSPHLAFGEVSPLQLALRLEREAATGARGGLSAGAEHYIRELGWREFSYHLLHHAPHTPEQPLNERFAAFPWRKPADYAADLAAWQRGRTGVPIVDAGMRQLWHTGWMHNRVRMIVASFLTKNLLIPWQEGARWFWDTLVDADLASNTMGWQWAAGSGADAAPYFRIFNPVLQGERFDADGRYVQHWVPELQRLSGMALQAPWQAKAELLRQAGVGLDREYPRPIVDLSTSRSRALAAYDHVKG